MDRRHCLCSPSVANREVIFDLRAAQHHTILMTLKYHIFLPILLETKRLYMHQRHLLVCGDIFIIPARALLFIYVQWTFFS